MHPGRPSVKQCPQGESFRDCNLQCKYHTFDDGSLQIYSWELKCLDCGFRSTIAHRSDDEDFDYDTCAPAKCPFCELQAVAKGRNLCQVAGN